MDTLLGIYRKYNKLVVDCFKSSKCFVAALDKACATFVNENPVTKGAKNGAAKSPELLARYCDSLLKKSAKNPEEVKRDTLFS